MDGMEISQLKAHLQTNGRALVEQIRNGSYQPSPIKGVEIPKPNGKRRMLGIPTLTDRVFQQALHQVLEPVFEPDFQRHSYGFRPNRNAHQAVQQAQRNINEGYQHVIDIDLKSFFDQVDHAILLDLVHQKVRCRLTMKLLRKFLRAPMQIGGTLHKRRKGVPQGSPLSPLLSNILLNELDKELEKRGHRYVRYADDFSIYVRSKKAARRVGNSIYVFLRDVLHLPINREKSGIRRPSTFNILGYHFVPVFKRGGKRSIPTGGECEKLESLQAQAQRADPQNYSHEFWPKNSTAQPVDKRLAELLQTGQHSRQITSYGQLAEKTVAVLYLAPLETP